MYEFSKKVYTFFKVISDLIILNFNNNNNNNNNNNYYYNYNNNYKCNSLPFLYGRKMKLLYASFNSTKKFDQLLFPMGENLLQLLFYEDGMRQLA